MITALLSLIVRLIAALSKLWAGIPDEEKQKAVALAAKLLRQYWQSKFDEAKQQSKGAQSASPASEKVEP